MLNDRRLLAVRRGPNRALMISVDQIATKDGADVALPSLHGTLTMLADRALVDGALGRDLTDADVEAVRDIVRSSGAFAAHEQMIRDYEEQALAAADALPEAPLLRAAMSSLEERRS